MERTPNSPTPGGGRVLLLGASNLTRILGHAVLEAGRDGAVEDLWIACGRGRSYGLESRTFGHRLPGIRDAALWDAVSSEGKRPTKALLMDVGNDLVYGVPVDRILAWVEDLIARIGGLGLGPGSGPGQTEIAMGGLPLESLEARSERTLGFWGRVFFPRRGTTPRGLIEGARELDRCLGALALERGVHFVRPPLAWYGLDPIHVRHRFAGAMARSWVGSVAGEPGELGDHGDHGPRGWAPWGWGLRLSLVRPHSDRWFGHRRRGSRAWVPGPRGVRVRLY